MAEELSVSKGEMRLYSSVRPDLEPDRYLVDLGQEIDRGAQAITPVRRHFEITGPRFSLAGTEVHSLFPPPNATGLFGERLAHIALKRRTLPWERASNDEDITERPSWLALVVLADGEANFLPGISIQDAYTSGVAAELGITDAGTCDTLEVSRRVVNEVFPREDELELLTHVRQVNLEDTENIGGDKDGFMAVLLSNRLPQAGLTYGAYLISLEGQFEELPDAIEEPADEFTQLYVYTDLELVTQASRSLGTGSRLPFGSTKQPVVLSAGSGKQASISAWNLVASTPFATPEAVPIAGHQVGFIIHDVDFAVLEDGPAEVLRFPVLAHWKFTCEGKGDFQSLMQNLDVGLIGTQPRTEEDEAPPAEPPFPMTDTGHTVIDHISRRGEAGDIWYRGAFTPREIERRAADAPFHAADQARRIAEDGREDLSLAAAFELGRLLALSDPRFVQDLWRWRRSGFRVRRRASTYEAIAGFTDLGIDLARVTRSLGFQILRAAGSDPARVLGPLIDPGGVDDLFLDDDIEVIAAGLGFETVYVAEVLAPALTLTALPEAPFGSTLETSFDRLAADPEQLVRLGTVLDETVSSIVSDTTRRPSRRTRTGVDGGRIFVP